MSANASAIVTVTLEVHVGGGAWGSECSVGQVYKQAIDDVRGRISTILKANPGVALVGDMQVKMITHPMEGRVTLEQAVAQVRR